MTECTVSFLIPYVLQLTKSEQHNDVIFSLLCGIIIIPVGVAFASIILSVDIVSLIFLLHPMLLAAILALGIVKYEKITVKIFIVSVGLLRRSSRSVRLLELPLPCLLTLYARSEVLAPRQVQQIKSLQMPIESCSQTIVLHFITKGEFILWKKSSNILKY